MAVAKKNEELSIDALKQGRVTLRLIGTTPFYFNAMSAKAKRSLLIGGGKKTAAERKQLKHDPEQEFRDSVYRQPTGDTLLCFPAPGIKAAMATAALETPGVTKTSVQRLIFLPQQKVSIWGKPLLKMDVVRSADMNKTPDVRTRAFLPRWCAEVDIAFVTPTLSVHSIVSLLSNAGVVCGIGDFRQEKGKGSFGTFAVSGEDMGDWQEAWDEITQEGRDVQQTALDDPEFADQDTADLMEVLEDERLIRRG
ncbi:hypothetical protein T8A63_07360 [Sulfitobacter sp. OXR-159]|uniref:hypothetical protein n=1 Tax=Sulfitobacter sp. OXR-159 TaxID=3100174 RepID=UPI002AC8B47D|nr:hypothetical protein [Sulfitobacter sp. OXR-159]WPZ30773.1 hypothetical protein T8A63_06850 [Sulfitobacter sp. OXR-159]WPZ30874.1 hypothetical protein T8A63_07360 [Sulfitobacter sp. OXR-159]